MPGLGLGLGLSRARSAAGGGGGAVTVPDNAAWVGGYSLFRLKSGFSGVVATACATSEPNTPTTTVDISVGADGSPDITAAVTAFGAVFDIWKLYDQTGVSGEAVAAVATDRMEVRADNPNGKLSLMKHTLGSYVVTGGTYARRDVSYFEVVGGAMGSSNPHSTFMFGDGFTSGLSVLTEFGGRGAVGSAFSRGVHFHGYRPTVVSVVSNPTNTKVRVGDRRQNLASQTAVSMSGFTLGRGFYTCDSKFFSAFLVYNAALSDTDEQAISDSLKAIFEIPTWTRSVYGCGDSIMYGQGPAIPLLSNRWALFDELLPANTFLINNGIPGQQQQSRTLAHFEAQRVAGTKQVYFENWGSNDFAANKTAATLFGPDDATAATVRFNIANARAAGFDVVRATVIKRTSFNTAQEAERVAFNQLLRDNAVALGYTVADYGDTVYPTADGTHPTAAGYESLAAIDAPVLNAALA